MNFWVGGALGTVPGAIIGAGWHFVASSVAERRATVRTVIVLGLMGAVIAYVAVVNVIPGMRTDIRMLDLVTQLDQTEVSRIAVYERGRKNIILNMTDQETNTAFAHSISDAVGHMPNHPRYSHSWEVIISGPTQYEVELHLDPQFPQSVIGYSFKETGDPGFYSGSFRSEALRFWVEEHLLPLSEEN
jgi:hypothetical protein